MMRHLLTNLLHPYLEASERIFMGNECNLLMQCTHHSTILALFSFAHTLHVEWCGSASQVTIARLKGVSKCKSFVLTRQVQVFRPHTPSESHSS